MSIRNNILEVAERVKLLRALAALAKDPGLFPSPNTVGYNHL